MMKMIYLIVIKLYWLAIKLASFFNPKAKLWIEGRKNWRRKLAEKNLQGKFFWFHISSLGEFEQARPVIEKLKEQFPDKKILITFFSPSGYEVRKNYALADLVFYLPLDTPLNARFFLGKFDVEMAFFVKYDLWYFFLEELKRRKIKTVLFSAIFRKEQIYFKWYGKWYAKILQVFSKIFVQDENSAVLLYKIGVKNVEVAGDTRFDRVLEIAEKSREIEIARQFCRDSFCIVAGSTWLEDEKLLNQFLAKHRDIKMIIAPHNIDEKHLRELTELLNAGYVRFSQVEGKQLPEKAQVLIIDNIGMLSALYKYGQAAYVGGGFGAGIHNILEAVVYGMPVVFGPNYEKFKEARDLISIGVAFSIKNYQELEASFLKFVNDKDFLKKTGEKAREYVLKNCGATEKILRFVKSMMKGT